jgi:hypothetical protein
MRSAAVGTAGAAAGSKLETKHIAAPVSARNE